MKGHLKLGNGRVSSSAILTSVSGVLGISRKVVIRITRQQLRRKIAHTVKQDCANFSMRKTCLLLDQPCPLLQPGIRNGPLTRCIYFEEAVLPHLAPLEAEYRRQLNRLTQRGGPLPTARCQSCHVPFMKTGRNQKFCPSCRDRQRKKAQAKASRAYRRRKAKNSAVAKDLCNPEMMEIDRIGTF
ncbi:hypothetical protein Sulac_0783 [Sulfobacillus acidophilus DSM 10332]|uniref:Cysteine-rich VLP domain-containing protein n=1 Tax=Sulfobacillus acidophilus (strain ATCC 700253 / DSM 10332 / NAL) TaxID=679936 RepID=G8U154_SULAD|nr:hypothetical protein Sulac_0783 [Sulfobacillus acidophilus DSM 10332]